MTGQMPDTIEVIEQVLDAKGFIAALSIGLLIGAAGIYIWQEYHKTLIKSIENKYAEIANLPKPEPEPQEVMQYGINQ